MPTLFYKKPKVDGDTEDENTYWKCIQCDSEKNANDFLIHVNDANGMTAGTVCSVECETKWKSSHEAKASSEPLKKKRGK